MTKEEQIALYNNANVTKKELIEEINNHINKYKWFAPINKYNSISSKIRSFCTRNNLQVLETNLFANKIPCKLKSDSYYYDPRNEIHVVVDNNKIKHLCCIRGGGVPSLLDVNTKITLSIIKLIYKTFVLDGVDVGNYVKFVKKTKIDVINFEEKYKDKLVIETINHDTILLKKLKKIIFHPKSIELVLDYERYTFINNTGQLQRTLSFNSSDRVVNYDSITKFFTNHSNDKLVSKDTLTECVLNHHNTKIKKLEEDLKQTLKTIESHF